MSIKAVPYIPGTWCIIETSTGEVLDDNYRQGYASEKQAYFRYRQNNRPTEDVAREREAQSLVIAWCLRHQAFVQSLSEEMRYRTQHGQPFDEAFVERELTTTGEEIPFSAKEFLRFW